MVKGRHPDIRDVRFWPKADLCGALGDVCFGPIADKKPMFAMPAAPPKMASVATTDHCQIKCWTLGPMVSFKPKDPQFRSRVEQSFDQQQVMKTLGVKILSLQPGEFELMMPYVAAYTQHTGFMHAGIIATVLDNACGYAAFSLVSDDTTMLTVEFKTNLLAPAKGERFIFRGKVVKPGRTITVCEAQAFAVDGSNEKLVATMTGTMMALFDETT